ncbi:hypothetical protein PROFUN_10221 [Planoprotostelium fungivorum]|uniref:Uncharacterized protein n=1 Tax=Planoprotostelium fungivorum TaxID=1890364 RepID=A0A2P6MQ71_9EUKA|nr:hypothetical protein PROFUN_10221 [Planoprotostelium fungivorum]
MSLKGSFNSINHSPSASVLRLEVVVFDLKSHNKCISFSTANRSLGMCMDIKMKSFNNEIYVCAIFESADVLIWSVRANQLMFQFKNHIDPAQGSAGSNIAVSKLDMGSSSHETEKDIQVNHKGIGAIRIRPDKKLFATGGWDRRLRIYNMRNLKPLAILKAHTSSINCIDFHPLSNLIASGGNDTKRSLCYKKLSQHYVALLFLLSIFSTSSFVIAMVTSRMVAFLSCVSYLNPNHSLRNSPAHPSSSPQSSDTNWPLNLFDCAQVLSPYRPLSVRRGKYSKPSYSSPLHNIGKRLCALYSLYAVWVEIYTLKSYKRHKEAKGSCI